MIVGLCVLVFFSYCDLPGAQVLLALSGYALWGRRLHLPYRPQRLRCLTVRSSRHLRWPDARFDPSEELGWQVDLSQSPARQQPKPGAACEAAKTTSVASQYHEQICHRKEDRGSWCPRYASTRKV